ncbi:MAG: hypothetical protein COZ80_13140 [Ignavibacteria bacterium CG_4_8_14_3_um_filter_37_9]|nr:nucleotidyltransferase family protein [Ignavibacteria bacterium]OIO16969.1 MAG: hypothetical protein AUJ54_10565 [Ignavibacteria bacterium CG1_02_37_35]PIP77961.1 MAG: hypothetical protein COW85_06270 [Ignavibacteria bacterium CG22_combo_CG10-13_8_21_14_all_37_15]PIS43743.1 MAG: hypothetical protein COT22_14250 [Ignavibacteria bacterium CG08_land_8_20_14_0_20_37_9]PIW97953.1 MAG: hypothetical protein COZ80_13140 [Ignavibacteria bacterium CG_4_8_14_3_um_filter_37_9]PIX95099.1 MAG: hypothetic
MDELNSETITSFCHSWKIKEFSFFGSYLRDDFTPQSDVDILIDLPQNHGLGLFEFVRMKEELEKMLGRKVDLLTKSSVLKSKNSIRRDEILKSHKVIYES